MKRVACDQTAQAGQKHAAAGIMLCASLLLYTGCWYANSSPLSLPGILGLITPVLLSLFVAQSHRFSYNEPMLVESVTQSLCDLALRFGEGETTTTRWWVSGIWSNDWLCFIYACQIFSVSRLCCSNVVLMTSRLQHQGYAPVAGA